MAGKYIVEIDEEGKVLKVSYNEESLDMKYSGDIQVETINSFVINKKIDPLGICIPDGHGGIR